MAVKDLALFAKWEHEIKELNQLIVAGQIEDCRLRLELITPKSIPRKFSAVLAQIANRVEYSLFALKILHPFIYPENSFDKPAESKEKLVYCHALLNLGAHQEARQLLDTVDPEQDVEVLFHKAMAHVSQWNYKKSIPLLKAYLKVKKIDPYRRMVAEVNLAAAYIAVNSWKQALLRLEKIQQSCREANYELLLGNSYELHAQVLFFQKEYAKALVSLEKGRDILEGQPGIYLFYIEKWMGFCQAFLSGDSKNFIALRKRGIDSNYSETVRECDLFEAILKKDEQLIRKVIMGTPSELYRERARSLFGKTLKPQGTFILQLTGEEQGAGLLFDPQDKVGPEQIRLSETPRLLALYEALTTDFYKPSYLGYLFKSIYPEEKFNPASSPARVLGLLNRLDDWFKAAQLPLEVHFKKSEFTLRATGPIRIVVRRGKKLTLVDYRWSEIRNELGHRPFTTSEVAHLVKISKASALRMVRQAIKENRIQSVGQASQAAYQFVK